MWTFSSPKVIFGEDALSHLDTLQAQKAFIVTDANMVKLGLVAQIEAHLQAANITSEVYPHIEPDPSIQLVQRCQQAMLDSQPDLIIGLGGGSCLDAAKAAWFLYERPNVDPVAITPFEDFPPSQKAKLIAISTTSGTGADISFGVVLTDEEEMRKITLVSPSLEPDIAIVDPALVMGLPPHITADTGMDVLSHAIESYASPWRTAYTIGLSFQAIELVFQYLPRAYADGQDMEAREAMHNASAIAGMAFSNASLALAHPMAHAMGGVFHTPHGRTVGMFLPYTIQYNAPEVGNLYATIARHLGLPAANDTEGTAHLVKHIRQLQAAIKQPRTIADMGISQDQLEEMMPRLVDNAVADGIMVTTPRMPDEAELARLYMYAFDGKDVDF